MQTKSDAELLRDYATDGSEAAFGEIVRRYADFVYSAALRQVFEPELARDVAQLVFVDLARKAGSLRPHTILIGWLCRGARLAALGQLRTQQRRLHRERQAMELADSSHETPNDWSTVRPVLDEAIATLGDEDRNALLLRFFKNESLASVGVTLGVSEDAAQKRVSRALERMREFLASRGIKTTAAALSVALTAHGVQAAPAGFAAALAAGALAKAAAGTSAIPLFNLLTSNYMKTAILSLILAGGVAGLTVQQIKTQRQLRAAQTALQQQGEDLQALQAAREQVAAQSDELEQLRAQAQDVVRLRGEVSRLRQEAATVRTPTASQMAASAAESTTNTPLPSIMLSAKFVLLPTEDLKMLNLGWSGNVDGSATVVLGKEQFQAINQALEGASDAKTLSSPRVVTANGVEANLFAGQGMSGPRTAFGHAGGSGGGGVGGRGTLTLPGTSAGTGPAGAGTKESPGVSLGVLPYVAEGVPGYDLQLTAGYSQWVDRSPQQDGSQKEIQSTQEKTRISVAEGQTVMMVKEVPDGGWTESDTSAPGPKSLLVFVTPAPFHGSARLATVVQRAETNH